MTTRPVFLNEKIAKKLFKNEKYGKMLSAKVISDVIGADYQEVLNNIQLSSEEIAFSALTVNSTSDAIYHDDKTYFNIELNFKNTKSKVKQLHSYVFQLYLGQLHTYKNYNKIKKIVQICIDAYDYLNKNDFMYKICLMDEKYNILCDDSIQIIHINIDYLRKLDYNEVAREDNKLMKDLYFLTCEDAHALETVYERDELMKKIVDEAKEIAGIEKMNLYLTDEEMLRQDEEFAFEQGRLQEMTDIIISLYHNSIPIELISKSVDLSVDEVKKIIAENDKM